MHFFSPLYFSRGICLKGSNIKADIRLPVIFLTQPCLPSLSLPPVLLLWRLLHMQHPDPRDSLDPSSDGVIRLVHSGSSYIPFAFRVQRALGTRWWRLWISLVVVVVVVGERELDWSWLNIDWTLALSIFLDSVKILTHEWSWDLVGDGGSLCGWKKKESDGIK